MFEIPLGWLQLKREKLRFAVALLGVSFAVVLILMQLGFREALFKSAVRFHDALNCDIVLVSNELSFIVQPRSFSNRRLYQARGVPGVESVTPVYLGVGTWKNPDTHGVRTIFVVGLDPADRALTLAAVNDQRRSIEPEDAVIFDELSRPEYGPIAERVRAGAPVTVELNHRELQRRRALPLRNLLRHRRHRDHQRDELPAPLPEPAARPDRDRPRSRGRRARIPGRVRDAIRALLPADVDVLTRADFAAKEIAYWDSSTPIGYVFSFGVIVGIVVGGIIVYQILFADVNDHLPEYATLKAMGYSNGFLAGVVIQQAVILAALGFLPGVAMRHRPLPRLGRSHTAPARDDARARAVRAGPDGHDVHDLRADGAPQGALRGPGGGVLMAAAAPIQLSNVNHYFGSGELRKQILYDVSVEIRAGEIVIVTGPSGSGKTTMLTLIGALRSAQEGSVQVLGAELRGASSRVLARVRREIGYIFQAHNLLDALDATQNVMMSLLLDRIGRREARRRPSNGSTRSGSATLVSTTRLRCPAGSASASRSPARSPARRASCSPTSRPRRSTSSPAARSST